MHKRLMLAAALALAACSVDEAAPPATGNNNQPSTGPQPAPAGSSSPTGAASGAGSSAAPVTLASAGRAAPTLPTPIGGNAPVGAPAAGSAAEPSAGSAGPSQTAGASATAGAGGNGGTGTATAGATSSDAGAGGSSSPPSGRAPLTSRTFAITTEHVSEAPIFNIHRPMDLTQVEGPLPVIAWANGGCFRSDFTWKPLFERWAKAGFVVLSLSSNGGEDDIFSMLGQTTKADHIKLVDWVFEQNKSGPYAGKLDLERVVIAGNSCGGVTALEASANEERVAAVFVLSGSSAVGSVNTNVMKAISIPVGYVVGGSEDVAGANASGDYDAMKEGVPGMIVSRRAGDHPTVSTDTTILPEVAEIAINWLDLALYGTTLAFDVLTSMDVCENCTPGDWKLKAKHLETLRK